MKNCLIGIKCELNLNKHKSKFRFINLKKTFVNLAKHSSSTHEMRYRGNKCENKFFSNYSCFKSFTTYEKNDSLEDIIPDHLVYNIPKYSKNPKEFDFPWLINGAPFLEIKARFLPEQVFVRSMMAKSEVLKHLYKVYRAVLLACSTYDFEFLKEYCEYNFYTKLKNKLEEFQKLKYTIEVVEDMKANKGARLLPEMHLYDCIIIKGLYVDREKNLKESDYSVCNDIEDMGFVSYIPNYLSDPNNFKTKEMAEDKLNQGEFKNLIFRSYCMFKTGLKLFVFDRLGNKIYDYPLNYNYNHAAIFECLMVPPPIFKSFSETETYTEWIAKHNLGVWKMIDLDNWMKGNPYFLSQPKI